MLRRQATCAHLVQALLECLEDPKVNAKDNRGFTPLHYASKLGYTQIARALLTSGADPELRVGSKRDSPTVLHLASLGGHLDIIKMLLEDDVPWKSNIGARCTYNGTSNLDAIRLAIITRKPRVAIQLLLGANAPVEDEVDNSLLHFCCSLDTPEEKDKDLVLSLMKIALSCGVDVNARGFEKYGRGAFQPLHVAAEANNPKYIALLLENGADIEGRDISECTPLLQAAARGNFDAYLALADSGANLKATASQNLSVLHLAIICSTEEEKEEDAAIKENRASVLKHALQQGGVNVNACSSYAFGNVVPLHLACKASSNWAVKLLLPYNPNLEVKESQEDFTPLLLAIADGASAEVVRDLIDKGANVNAYDAYEDTALDILKKIDIYKGIGGGLFEFGTSNEDQHSTAVALVNAGARQWDLLPNPCPGLEAALPAVMVDDGPEGAACLFRLLQREVQAQVQEVLLCLNHTFSEPAVRWDILMKYLSK